MKRPLPLLLFILLNAFQYSCLGQSYKLETFTTRDGLMSNDVKGVFQDDLGIIYVANEVGFTRFYGDHVDNLKSNTLRFARGSMPNVKKTDGGYYCMGHMISNNEIYRISFDENIDWHTPNFRFYTNNSLAYDSVLEKSFDIPDDDGYQWTYHIAGFETDSEQVLILRYKKGDTTDLGSILKNSGVQMSNISNVPYSKLIDGSVFDGNFRKDNQGNRWIRSTDGRIHQFDNESLSLRSINDTFPDILQVWIDKIGFTWIQSYSEPDDRQVLYKCSDSILEEHKFDGFLKLYESKDGTIYALDSSGVFRYGEGIFERAVPQSNLSSIAIGNRNQIVTLKGNWDYSKSTPLIGKEASVSILEHGNLKELYRTQDIVYQVFIDRENCIWISTSNGLIKCTYTPIQFVNYPSDWNRHPNLKYLHTTSNGVRIFHSQKLEVLYETNDGKLKKLIDGEVLPGFGDMPTDNDGNIYMVEVSSSNEKILLKDLLKVSDNLDVKSILKGNIKASLDSMKVVAGRAVPGSNGVEIESGFNTLIHNDLVLMTFPSDGILMGRNDEFEFIPIDKNIYEWIVIMSDVGLNFGLTLGTLKNHTLVTGRHGNTRGRRYLQPPLKFSYDSKSFERFFPNDTTYRVSLGVTAAYNDSCWLSFHVNNLVIHNEKQSTTDTIPINPKFAPFPNGKTRPVPLPDGEILWSRNGVGLIKLKPADSSLVSFGVKEGLASSTISNFYFGQDSLNLWIETPVALQRVSVPELLNGNLKVQGWPKENGYLPGYTSEFTSDSLLCIYSETGYSMVNLHRLNGAVEPLLYLRGVRLFYDPVNWRDFTSSVDSSNGFSIPIRANLSYDQNHMTFDFQGVSQTSLEGLHYRYRLNGQDEQFYTTDQKSATYTNLRPGNYTFEISAIDEYGNESASKTVEFTITKPFWQTVWFITLASLSLLLSLYVLYRWRVRALKERQVELETEVKNATKEIREKKEQVEKKNDEIMASITYAKKLQTAVLPPARVVKEYFSQSFLLYLPRDIVSGDFYWMESNNDVSYFAVADCTGHGVPGAMLSVIGMNGLNRALNEQHLTQPKDILTSLSEHIQRHFEQSEATVRDGMDICLCALDNRTMKLTYAGANNPVWIVRNGEMHILKADRRAIGHDDQNRAFTQQEFQLQKDDTVYLSSDGYQDQIGGEKNRKLMTKVFRERLVQLSVLPMDEQRQTLLTEHEAWKGSGHQTDDICLMGIRV